MRWLLSIMMMVAGVVSLSARTWTNSDGKKVEAELIRVEVVDGQKCAILRKPGNDREYQFPVSKLSAEDQRFIAGFEKGKELLQDPRVKEMLDGALAPDDNSLTVDEYIKAGMPSPDRIWSGGDMQKALGILKQLPATQLPRQGSERSGSLFARITSAENLQVYRNRSVPVAQRFPSMLVYAEAAKEVANLYHSAFTKRAAGGRELVEMIGLLMRLGTLMVQLIDELPPIDPADPQAPQMKAGLEQVNQGMAMVASGSIAMAEDVHLTASERKRLLKYVHENFPILFPKFAPSVKQEIMVKLHAMVKDPKNTEIQRALEKVLERLEPLAK